MKTKILTTALAIIIGGTMAFAQDKSKSETKKSSTEKTELQKDSVYYTCSMHPEVKEAKPGKCPTCGMSLEKKTVNASGTMDKKEEKKVYGCCPGCPDVKSDKPGKCPKCGMQLVEKKK